MKRFLGFDTVLCLSPHPDDVEYSVSGTIISHPGTCFDQILLSYGTKQDACSSRYLEVELFWKHWSHPIHIVGPNPNSAFEFDTTKVHEALEILATSPTHQAWLIPSLSDTHQEHRIVSELARTATRHYPITLIEYRTASTTMEWTPNMIVQLSKEILDKKFQALRSAFTSQLDAKYFNQNTLRSFHQHPYHIKKSVDYAEHFKVDTLFY